MIMASLLFVCLHNACRSRIAAAIAAKAAPGGWLVLSAGFDPSSQYDPKAAEILRRHDLSMGEAKPRGLAALPRTRWDCVIGMGCGDLRSAVEARTYGDWLIADPNNAPLEAYEVLYGELSARVLRLVADLGR